MSRIDSEQLRKALKLYFIFGSNNCLKNPAEVLQDAIEGGITLFQYREKGKGSLDEAKKMELAKQLQTICRSHTIPFIINDDIELALKLDADGVHIGQEDEKVEVARKKIGDKILGVSAHTVEEVQRAIDCGADYLGLGPIFPTMTKEDAKAVQGTKLMQEVREKGFSIPMVGIGGINADNTHLVMKAKADGVALISAISQAENIVEIAKKIKNITLSF